MGLAAVTAIINFDDLRNTEKELQKIFGVENKPAPIELLKEVVNDLHLNALSTKNVLTDVSLCGICKFIVTNLQRRILPVDAIAHAVCNLYFFYKSLNYNDVCKLLLEKQLPILKYIADNSKIITPTLACSILLQNKQCYDHNNQYLSWTLEIPERRPFKPKSSPGQNKNLKILHLTDFHLQMDYQAGSIADCGYPLCCKKNFGNALTSHKTAGFWGSYTCDTNLEVYKNFLRHLNSTYKVDAVYYTGDNIDHSVWNTTKEQNKKIHKYIFQSLRETFPNVPIFPAIGNHETSPLNVYPPREITIKEFDQQWLYDLLSEDSWKPWLDEQALKTVKKQGYYSYLLRENFRIIALNNNVCYNFNWWLLYDTKFLQEQLNFLRETLENAERNGEYVHIISHIPYGNRECIEPWEKYFIQLMERFEHIIPAVFFGHTHRDQLKVFYSQSSKKPILVGYNGGSLTTHLNKNPNYKLFHLSGDNYEILDVDTYIFNLTEANLHSDRSPAWFHLYSFKKDYNLSNLSPKSVSDLAHSIENDSDRFQQYYKYFVCLGDEALKKGCDTECKQTRICEIDRKSVV